MKRIFLEILYNTILKELKNRILSYEEIEEVCKKEYPKLLDRKRVKTLAFQKEILEFEQFLRQNVPEACQNDFYHNINRVVISPKDVKTRKITSTLSLADYDCYKVKIRYNSETSLGEAAYHELFHLSSASILGSKDKISVYSGLSQTILTRKAKKYIGYRLDEGYTELLTLRHFKNDDTIGCYIIEVCLAKKIEEIIGEEKMYQYYFSSNIKGLIDDLTKYNSREKVLEFFYNLELFGLILKKPFFFENSKITNCIHSLTGFCYDCYERKLELDLQKGEISKEEFHVKLLEFIAKGFNVHDSVESVYNLVKEPKL